MTPEGKVKREVTRALKEIDGVSYFMPPASQYGRAGVSDYIICADGVFIALETKAAGGVLSALQRKYLDEVVSCGGVGLVVYPNKIIEVLPGGDDVEVITGGLKEAVMFRVSSYMGYGGADK